MRDSIAGEEKRDEESSRERCGEDVVMIGEEEAFDVGHVSAADIVGDCGIGGKSV